MTHKHGDRNRYLHGPDEHDRPGKGCRCRQCRNANNRTQNQRRLAIATGRHQPMVDAQPVREHVVSLHTAGLSYDRVAELAGVGEQVVRCLIYGKPTSGAAPTRRLNPSNAAALLAVRPDQLPSGGWVSAIGTQRRLRALAAMGWPTVHIATRVGVRHDTIQKIGRCGPERRVDAGTARAVRAAYDELWDVDPVSAGVRATDAKTVRTRAARKGWPGALAWDDDTIDDPAAAPDLGEKTSRQDALAEDADDLIEQGYTFEFAAERLGVGVSYLHQARHRVTKRTPAPVGVSGE